MQVSYSLTVKDWMNFHTRTRKQTPQPWYRRWGSQLLFPALGLLVFVRSPLAHGDWRLVLVMAVGITLVWRGLFYGVSRAATVQMTARRPGAMTLQTLSLLPEGVANETRGMTSQMPWRDCSEIADEGGYLVLRTNAYPAVPRLIVFFIPERVFGTRADAHAFLDEARHLQAEATDPALERFTAQSASNSRISVPFSLTAGEFVWMLAQDWRKFVWTTDLLTPLALAFFFSSAAWAASGNLIWSSVFAVILCGVLLSGRRRIAQSGPTVKGAAARMIGDYRLTLTPQGVEQQSPAIVSWFPWPTITQITEKRRYVLFYVDNAVVCLVPLSAFGGEDEAQAFVRNAQALRQGALAGAPLTEVEQVQSWPPPPRR